MRYYMLYLKLINLKVKSKLFSTGKKAVDMGVDGMTVDFPDKSVNYLIWKQINYLIYNG